MFDWIFSFFSGESHISYVLKQLESIDASIEQFITKLETERADLIEFYNSRNASIEERMKKAERISTILESINK